MAYQRKRKNGACTNCRRAHQKCEYPDEDKTPLECRRCIEKGLKCERKKRKKNRPRIKTESEKIKKSTRAATQAKSAIVKTENAGMTKVEQAIKKQGEKKLKTMIDDKDIERYNCYMALFSTTLEEKIFEIDTQVKGGRCEQDECKDKIHNLFDFPIKNFEEELSDFIETQKQKLKRRKLDKPEMTVLIMLQYVQINLKLNAFYYRHAKKKKEVEFQNSFYEPFSTLRLLRYYVNEKDENVSHTFFYSTVAAYFYYLMEKHQVETFSLKLIESNDELETKKDFADAALNYAKIASTILLEKEFRLTEQMLQLAYSMLITVYKHFTREKELEDVIKSLNFLNKNNGNIKMIATLKEHLKNDLMMDPGRDFQGLL
mmetsp:Transcript_3158/g.4664  ORF Transcript_3158/g.4664 Transcript_3158/m.4664 type:complete len:373 (+) Transcript_3158:98-1216(+)